MGSFFESIHLKTTEITEVIRLMSNIYSDKVLLNDDDSNVNFIISPAINGWINIYHSGDCQSEKVSEVIAQKYSGLMIHFIVHDSDVFYYMIYNNGELIDQYNSWPDYFDGAMGHVFGYTTEEDKKMLKGKPEVFIDLVKGTNPIEEINQILNAPKERIFDGNCKLRKLADILGIKYADLSYKYILSFFEEDSIKYELSETTNWLMQLIFIEE
jgi:hypothetical protein